MSRYPRFGDLPQLFERDCWIEHKERSGLFCAGKGNAPLREQIACIHENCRAVHECPRAGAPK